MAASGSGMSAVTPGLVSVVVTTYNLAEFVAETLASVAAQRYAPIEVIVADNESTDDTRDVAMATGIPGTLVRVQERGPGSTRNAGMALARGEFLQLLDGDDLLEPDKIGRQVEALRATGGDVAWAPFWRYEPVSPDGAYRKSVRVEPQIGDDTAASILRADGFIQLGALLLRRRPGLDALRFETRGPIVEDVRWMLDLAHAGARFVRSPGDSGLLYRQHGGTRFSGRPQQEFAIACFNNAKASEDLWRARGELTPPRIAALTDTYLYSLRTLHGRSADHFRQVLDHLSRLNPAFVERLPARLRLPTRLFGYAAAESLASAYRVLTGMLRGGAGRSA